MAKFCKKCGETKPVSEFGKKAKMRDGLQSSCKVCTRAAEARLNAANPEKRRAICAKYRAAHPDRRAATFAKWYAANRERSIAAAAKWAAANRDKVNANLAKWHAANPEKKSEYHAKWYEENSDKAKARVAKWAAENPETVLIYSHNRRARKRANGGKLSKGLTEKLFKLQKGKCACGCKQSLGDDYHMDHIMPLVLGGANSDDNIQLLRAVCNMKKNAKDPIDFMQQRGFLC